MSMESSTSSDQCEEDQLDSGPYYDCDDDEDMAFNLLLDDVRSMGKDLLRAAYCTILLITPECWGNAHSP